MDGPIVIAMLNKKGGVGKTSLTFHSSGAFAQMGMRVLLIDLDPQSNLSQGFFGSTDVEQIPLDQTVVGLFHDSMDPEPEHLIRPTGIENISLVPAADELEDFDHPRGWDHGEYQFCLKEFIDEVKEDFDVIMVDCSPSLKLLSWNALVASEFVICPFQPEDFGVQGITRMQRFIDEGVARQNRNLRLLGYLINSYRNRADHNNFEAVLRRYYEDDVFKTVVPNAGAFPQAVTAMLPVGYRRDKRKGTVVPRKNKSASIIMEFAQEVMQRVPAVRAQPPHYLYLGNIRGTDGTAPVSEDQLRHAG